MVSLLFTKFHEILFSSFRGVALTNCDEQDKNNMSPHKSGPGDIIIIRRKESVSHKEDTIYEYIYYIKKSLKIIIVFFTLNNLLFFS